jgi:hypothetical protein
MSTRRSNTATTKTRNWRSLDRKFRRVLQGLAACRSAVFREQAIFMNTTSESGNINCPTIRGTDVMNASHTQLFSCQREKVEEESMVMMQSQMEILKRQHGIRPGANIACGHKYLKLQFDSRSRQYIICNKIQARSASAS